MLVLFVYGGSPVWQVARALMVAGVAVAAAFALPRVPVRLGGAMQLVLGLVVMSTGVGIAVPHLSKLRPGLIGVVGAIGVAVGVVLIVLGAIDLLHAAPIWLRVLSIPALIVVTALAVFVIGQSVAATNVPATRIDDERRIELGDRTQDVELTTADGVRLSGWYVPSTNGAAVALLHGAGSTRTAALRHARLLSEHGYGVLVFDARGHGRSEGRAMDFGWYGDQDAGAAVSFLADRPEVDPGRIALVGLSMGGEQAIGALAADDRVAAVVAEGATARRAEDATWLSDEYGWRGSLQRVLESAMFGVTDVLTAVGPPTPLADALTAAEPRPVLMIAGGEMPDEIASNEWLRDHAPASVELWVAPDTGHTAALRTHPEEYERRVTEFLDRSLAAPTA
jgi:fermentation-respiration switch protein FrsA (DUF1100 family)